MLLYISGSFPNFQDGIADGADILYRKIQNLDNRILLLTTRNEQIISYVNEQKYENVQYLKSWKTNITNVANIFRILKKNSITEVHVEYPGILYRKTFLASFIPLIIIVYNIVNGTDIICNYRLHEFTMARFLRKVAIFPILIFSKRIYVPSYSDWITLNNIFGNKIIQTKIGANIDVYPLNKNINICNNSKINIGYFGAVYHGKGIEQMLRLWKRIKDIDTDDKFTFTIIGEISSKNNNHFSKYHNKIEELISELGLNNSIRITGYVSKDIASLEIQKITIATLLFEDGLTLRRGSFLAFLSHGIPIITTEGDFEASRFFNDASGVYMSNDEELWLSTIIKWSQNPELLHKFSVINNNLGKIFNWNNIAAQFIADYKMGE